MRKILLVAVVFALFVFPVAASAQEAETPRVQGSVLPSYGHLHPFAGARVMRIEIMTRAE